MPAGDVAFWEGQSSPPKVVIHEARISCLGAACAGSNVPRQMNKMNNMRIKSVFLIAQRYENILGN